MSRIPITFVYPNCGPHHRAALNDCHERIACALIELAPRQSSYPWTGDVKLNCPRQLASHGGDLESLDAEKALERISNILDANPTRAIFTTRYDLSVMRKIAAEAKRRKIPSVLMCDSTWADRPRVRIKEYAKRYLLRPLYDGALAAGTRSVEYLRSLGFPASRIWTAVNVVDVNHFEGGSDRARFSAVSERARLRLPAKYILGVGRHAPEKNFATLIRAFASYAKRHSGTGLVLCGSGPLTGELRKAVSSHGIEDRVSFPGWASYNDLPSYYALAQMCVLPSVSEPWGLVVNESLSCRTPVLVSSRCGCVPELVRAGVTGYEFDPKDREALFSLIEYAASDQCSLAAMGDHGRLVSRTYSLSARTCAIRECLRALAVVPE